VISIEVDELHTNALHDGPDIRIPLREDVITVLHQTSVLEIGSRLASQTPGSLKKSYPPAAQCELTGCDYAR
jgi:hypothetical protein